MRGCYPHYRSTHEAPHPYLCCLCARAQAVINGGNSLFHIISTASRLLIIINGGNSLSYHLSNGSKAGCRITLNGVRMAPTPLVRGCPDPHEFPKNRSFLFPRWLHRDRGARPAFFEREDGGGFEIGGGDGSRNGGGRSLKLRGELRC